MNHDVISIAEDSNDKVVDGDRGKSSGDVCQFLLLNKRLAPGTGKPYRKLNQATPSTVLVDDATRYLIQGCNY